MPTCFPWPPPPAHPPVQRSRGISKIRTALISLIASFAWIVSAAEPLPRSVPEAQGIPSPAILNWVQQAESKLQSLHSFMILRHGHVVAEGWWKPYTPESRHELYSLSKSFTSTAVGIAISEQRFTLDDTVASFFPDQVPTNASPQLKAMRVRDLLCMSAGHDRESATAADVMTTGSFLQHPVPFKPGTHFLYNTPATFMLSAILQKSTGLSLHEYLQPRLFQPLGITQATWSTNSQGISLGGYGLSVRTEDIARFGQLYLQKGKWGDAQLIPEHWTQLATSKQTSNGSNPASDWEQGYGFQFWRSRHNAYRGDGAFGQYCIVLPEHDAVIAITSGLKDMQTPLNLVWDVLLPSFSPRKLPRNPNATRELQTKLASLSLPRPTPATNAPTTLQPFQNRTFLFPPNDPKLESLRLEPGPTPESITLVLRAHNQESRLICNPTQWSPARLTFWKANDLPAASAGAWIGPATFQTRVCLTETPYALTFTLQFADRQVSLDAEFNVAFGPSRTPRLIGLTE